MVPVSWQMGALRRLARRLFACACCRSLWDLLPDPRSRSAVEAAEAFADQRVDAAGLRVARDAAVLVLREVGRAGLGSDLVNAARMAGGASRRKISDVIW